jgi:hypothetical protein
LEQTDPKAYQRKLEGLVAERPPLAVLSETADALRAILKERPALAFQQRPFPGKWTPNEIIGHLTDAEWALGYRTRTVLCDDHPRITPYDQERWVTGQGHNERQPQELVELFAALRSANLSLWQRLKPAQLSRAGLHAERGEETLEQMLRLLAGHDLSHLDQIRRYLAAVKS